MISRTLGRARGQSGFLCQPFYGAKCGGCPLVDRRGDGQTNLRPQKPCLPGPEVKGRIISPRRCLGLLVEFELVPTDRSHIEASSPNAELVIRLGEGSTKSAFQADDLKVREKHARLMETDQRKTRPTQKHILSRDGVKTSSERVTCTYTAGGDRSSGPAMCTVLGRAEM